MPVFQPVKCLQDLNPHSSIAEDASLMGYYAM